jgi:hypothetical protein
MVAPPGEEEFYLKGISEVIGRVPFFGGSAADNAIAGEWLLYSDKLITADGVAVAFFYSGKPFANQYTGAYDETKKAGIITKVDQTGLWSRSTVFLRSRNIRSGPGQVTRRFGREPAGLCNYKTPRRERPPG